MKCTLARSRSAAVTAVAATAALTASVLATPAHGAPAQKDWKSYLLSPKTAQVKPVKATVLTGKATNANALASGGATTLTVPAGGKPTTVLLDYGREVLGTPTVKVKSYTNRPALPVLSLAFTEARGYLKTPGAGTLASDAAVGATTITLTAPRRGTLSFAVGDTVVIGGDSGESNTVTAVSGTTLTLAKALTAAHPATTAVTSTPGAITGDSAFNSRVESLTVNAKSTLRGTFQGGFRFEAITLTQPGTVTLSGAGVDYTDGGVLAKASDYQGHFLSSSDSYNKMYYSGAYTTQTNLQPAGVSGAAAPSVLDGAKRDRAIWSGDLKIQGQNIATTLGSNANNYVKQSLLTLITASPKGGGLNADTLGRNQPYSNSYSHWTVDAATDYYRNTADTAFAQQILPWLEGQLTYDATLVDANGLLVTGPSISTTNGGYDWDFYDGAKTGEVTAYNVLYYRALQDVAYVEDQLGASDKADSYRAAADKLKAAINATLINPATGAYWLSNTDHSTLAQDGNSLAILFDVAPKANHAKIVTALKSLWGPHGSAPYSAGSPYDTLISPYITAFEVEALYVAGYTADAEQLLHLTWDQMTDPKGAYYTGTFWENIGADGTATLSRTSLAHGWASGPTPIMAAYVLGVQPTDPGYKTFTVHPRFGSTQWAKGTVPTPYGQITVSWKNNNGRTTLTVDAPPGTTADIQLGSSAQSKTVRGGKDGASKSFDVSR